MPDLQVKSVLYLDDMRVPTIPGVDLVTNYDEFIQYINLKGVPDLISFDHDLADEHYPRGANVAGEVIDYDAYTEKTGLAAVRYLIENGFKINLWMTHTMNVQGKINMEAELRAYCPQGELRGVRIPYVIRQDILVTHE